MQYLLCTFYFGMRKAPHRGGMACVCVSYMAAMVSDQIEYSIGFSVISRVVRLVVMPCWILYLFG